jgi:hypothetical protein
MRISTYGELAEIMQVEIVPFIVSLSRAALSHKQSAFAGTSRDAVVFLFSPT